MTRLTFNAVLVERSAVAKSLVEVGNHMAGVSTIHAHKTQPSQDPIITRPNPHKTQPGLTRSLSYCSRFTLQSAVFPGYFHLYTNTCISLVKSWRLKWLSVSLFTQALHLTEDHPTQLSLLNTLQLLSATGNNTTSIKTIWNHECPVQRWCSWSMSNLPYCVQQLTATTCFQREQPSWSARPSPSPTPTTSEQV